MNQERRSGWKIMWRLIGLVKPLLHIMMGAVLLGTAGYLCAIFLTITAGVILLKGIPGLSGSLGVLSDVPAGGLMAALAVMAVLRGILHYAEQYCNHFIAFKLLAIIRHKVFAALRRLCPAKLEGRDKGNLISVITTDIELLEVFYAHTVSPVAIAALASLFMVIFIGKCHVLSGLLAFVAYVAVGVCIPLWNGKRGGSQGMEFRSEFGELNSFVLDSLRGLEETLQYSYGQERKQEMEERSGKLGVLQKSLSQREGAQRSVTNMAVLISSFGMLLLMLWLYGKGEVGYGGAVLCVIAMMGSFGPVAALSNLSNNLNQTLASGERVLSILEEKPEVEEVPEKVQGSAIKREDGMEKGTGAAKGRRSPAGQEAGLGLGCAQAAADHVTFAYEKENILEDYSICLERGKITGIHGASGSGKSTLLKLFMRFWDVDGGRVLVDGADVREIPTRRLRDTEAYVTQDTHMFHDSIANNIAIGKDGASMAEIVEAAKKASIHDFVLSLPKGYDTEVGELGDTLSGGERQRIGIARAFLHDAPFLLLDEPTSNLDSLNEGIILKALKDSCREKTMVLVSHRESTMRVADRVWEI